MSWAKRADAIALVKAEYARALGQVEKLSEADRGLHKIPKAIDDYLSACRTASRQVNHELIEVCMDLFLRKNRQLSWRTR